MNRIRNHCVDPRMTKRHGYASNLTQEVVDEGLKLSRTDPSRKMSVSVLSINGTTPERGMMVVCSWTPDDVQPAFRYQGANVALQKRENGAMAGKAWNANDKTGVIDLLDFDADEVTGTGAALLSADDYAVLSDAGFTLAEMCFDGATMPIQFGGGYSS